MKKIFTLITAAMTAISAMANDYTDKLSVMVNGMVASEQTTTISLSETDGTTTFKLDNFVLVSDDSPMPVGNIVLTGVKKSIAPTEGENAYTYKGIIKIEEGTAEGVDVWLGPMLGDVPVELRASQKGDKVYAAIDITMESLGQTINVVFGSRNYQIPNSDFEKFHKAGKATEPNHWHSFQSAKGTLSGQVVNNIHLSQESETRPGSNGYSSVKLVPKNVLLLAWANGTMTTGRMVAGSMTPSDPANHAELDLSDTAKDENGDPFYTLMDGHPDALKIWAKSSVKSGSASISAIITDGTYYQDPENKTYNNYTSKAQAAINTGEQWKEITVPFAKSNNNVEPKAILVTISTNGTPGKGSKEDYIMVDDMELVYNPQAKSIKFDGKEISGFKADTYEYEMDAAADIDKISVETYGITDITLGEDNKTVTVMTTSEDLLKSVVYTLKFKDLPTGIENIGQKAERKVVARYNAAGQTVGQMQKGMVITRYSDGSVVKSMK